MGVYNRYPPEVHEFVKDWCQKLRDKDLANACNKEFGTHFTEQSIKAFRGNHGYRNYMTKKPAGEEYWKWQTRWPKGMFEYIRDNSWGVSSKEMAERVNELFGTDFTPSRMKVFRAKWHVRSGITGWYQKGHTPGTKGKTLEEICGHDPEKLARVRQTQFKPGRRPENEKPIGTIVINKDGYKIRKKQMEGEQWERWEFLHRAVWEEHNGPVPEGMIVSFKDSDRLNCDIDNLMLISRGEASALTRLNYRFDDPDLTMAALGVVRLRQPAKKIRKGDGRTK